MSVISIQCSPSSSVMIGTPVTFTVISGISSGVYITYEWYLNDTLVSIGTGYTLTNPQQNDEVYVKILNCMANVTDWNEDISFYYNDVIPGVPQVYYVDLLSSFNYRITSAVMRCDNQLVDAEIQIDGTPIVWTGAATSIDVTSTIHETLAVSSNNVSTNNIVTLVTNGPSDTATLLQGKLRIVRLI